MPERSRHTFGGGQECGADQLRRIANSLDELDGIVPEPLGAEKELALVKARLASIVDHYDRAPRKLEDFDYARGAQAVCRMIRKAAFDD